MADSEFTVVVEQDEDGFYVAEVPALKGCYTQGKTLEEALKNIREVIDLCLEDEENKDLPRLKLVKAMTIKVPA